MLIRLILFLVLFVSSSERFQEGVVFNRGEWVSSGDQPPFYDPEYSFRVSCQLQIIAPWMPMQRLAIANFILDNNHRMVFGANLRWHHKVFDGDKFLPGENAPDLDLDLQEVSLEVYREQPQDRVIISHQFGKRVAGVVVRNSKSSTTVFGSGREDLENRILVGADGWRSHLICSF